MPKRSPLTTSKMMTRSVHNVRKILIPIVLSGVLAYMCFALLPEVFDTWHERTVDRLFVLRADFGQPTYDSRVAHVDITDSSLEALGDFYVNRLQYAQAVRNLHAMDVAAQVWDVVLPGRIAPDQDAEMLKAVGESEHTYFGIAFVFNGLASNPNWQLKHGSWSVPIVKGAENFYTAHHALTTYADLAKASQGLGFLNVPPDPDGVFRRIPLLVQYGQTLYPSIVLRVVCDYLQVTQVEVSRYRITLHGAVDPVLSVQRDVELSIDEQGRMRVNFIGAWDRMTHYNFADVLSSSDDRDELDLWREELSGKIVVVSDVTTGSSDMGPVPTDSFFPMAGIHANAIHTILTGSFFKEVVGFQTVLLEVVLLALLFVMAMRLSQLHFGMAALGLMLIYVVGGSLLFVYGNTILNLVRPIVMPFLATGAVLVIRYVDELEFQVQERTRELEETHAELVSTKDQLIYKLDSELQTAHEMQMALMPEVAPNVEGLDIAGRCRPASHVGGDFFQFYRMSDDRLLFVLADVTGHWDGSSYSDGDVQWYFGKSN